MKIYCIQCKDDIDARSTTGIEVYPHRIALKSKPYWICDSCKNYVGCHSGDNNNGQPLGVIPTAELRKARMSVHAILDPIWRNGTASRNTVYRMLKEKLGYNYHSGETKTVEECENARLKAIEIKESSI